MNVRIALLALVCLVAHLTGCRKVPAEEGGPVSALGRFVGPSAPPTFRAHLDGWSTSLASSSAHVDRLGGIHVRRSPGDELLIGAPFARRNPPPPVIDQVGTARLRIDFGVFEEELVATPQGIEQMFRFAGPPEADGDLLITMQVDALHGEARADGVHLLARGGANFLYGPAQWIDAGGRTWPVAERWSQTGREGQLTLVVPSAALREAKYPVVLDPLISPEFEIDSPVLPPDFSGGAGYSSISAGATAYLVAEYRSFGMTATRVAFDGGLLDPVSFIIGPPNSGGGTNSHSAWDGNEWFVVWQGSQLHGTRVTGAGQVLDTPPIVVASNTDYLQAPQIAFNGAEYLVAWGSSTWPPFIGAARVLPDAGILDPGGLMIADGGYRPALATDGSNFLVAWYASVSGARQLFAARVSEDGAVLDSPPIPVSSANSALVPATAVWDGTQYVLAWTTLSGQVVARRVAVDGGLLDPAPIALGITGYEPQAASDGTLTVVFAGKGDSGGAVTTSAAWLRPDGTVATARVVHRSIYGSATGAAAIPGQVTKLLGDELLVAPSTYNGPVVMGMTVGTTPPFDAGAPFLIQTRMNSEREPSLAVGGGRLLLVWNDNRQATPGSSIWGQLSSSALDYPSGGAFVIGTNATSPSVASSGNDFLVTWQGGGAWSVPLVRVGRVLPDAGVPDYPGVNLGNGVIGNVAHGAGRYVVFWVREGTGVVATPANIGATAFGTTVALSAPSVPVGHVRGTFEGDSFLAVWEQGSPPHLQASRYWLDGGSSPDGGFVLAASSGSQSWPSVASDGTRTFVSWREAQGGVTWLKAVLAETDGGRTPATGPFLLAPSVGGIAAQEVVFDGANYIVTWIAAAAGVPHVFATRVAPDGTILDPAGLLSPSSDAGVSTLGLASLSPGRTLVVASRYRPEWRAERLFGQVINTLGCSTDSDCYPPPACHWAGSCDPYQATCDWLQAPDNTLCEGGTGFCLSGTCNVVDAGRDAGEVDAGEVDAGEVDAGEVDAGEVDAGEVDSGVVDAGYQDAGSVDGGNIDGGAGGIDAGRATPDGGQSYDDAGVGVRSPARPGCGCNGVPQTGLAWSLLILAMAHFRARQRSRHPRAR